MLKSLNRSTTGLPRRYPVKVLQFGEGNFLRAFADWMIDVMNEKSSFHGSVQLVQPISQGMANTINHQDGLYHVVLNGIRNGKAMSEIRLITCVDSAINPFENFNAFLATAENPDLRFILSNTTEAGIAFSPSDNDPTRLPETFPGKLTLLLHHRFNHFNGAATAGLTIVPCELIDRNGDMLKRAVLQYVDLWSLGSGFREWLTAHTIFCNTLVDRIVPGFPKETIKEIQNEVGYEDNLVVSAEPFHLWVIEAPSSVKKQFPADDAGFNVKFVDDITPYRTRKVRILNGAHTAMVPVAYLQGLRTVKATIDNETTGAFVRELIYEEIIPTLDLPKEELETFAADVIERFQNPFIKHELSSIALNSISKFQVRVLPSILEFHNRKQHLPKRLLHSLAALIVFYKGEWKNEKLPVSDTPSVIEFFRKAWEANSVTSTVEEILSNHQLWGCDLLQIPGLKQEVEKQVGAYQRETALARVEQTP
jgi:tagaturonate reductase